MVRESGYGRGAAGDVESREDAGKCEGGRRITQLPRLHFLSCDGFRSLRFCLKKHIQAKIMVYEYAAASLRYAFVIFVSCVKVARVGCDRGRIAWFLPPRYYLAE